MVVSIILGLLTIALMLASLAWFGRKIIFKEIKENEEIIQDILDFHGNLVRYANSNGTDNSAFLSLVSKSSNIEAGLGSDNFVNGIHIGSYLLTNYYLLPFSLHEMRRNYNSEFRWDNSGAKIADSIQTVLFRHAGRRENHGKLLRNLSKRFWACVAYGWTSFAALPISVLQAFGIISESKAGQARQSWLFKLWKLSLAIGTLVSPVIAYLADSEKVDSALRAMLQ